jgi:glycosyltransferase involved in cell wall biosynthesis
MEDDLVRRSDLVLTSSARLAAERRFLNPNTHFVSHGVDLRHFHRALDREIEVPEDLRRLPGPVIGFFGLLADWVDQDAIAAVARAHPEWSVVLIGKAVTDLRAVSRIPNVHLLGQKPYAVLPDYCRGFDVAILPFVTNELTVRANPLKLREYLAAGLPVVSTPLPEVARYRELIRLAETPGQFVTEVERALEEHSLFESRTRVRAMAAESWEVRVEEIRDLVDRARVEEQAPAAAVPGVAR